MSESLVHVDIDLLRRHPELPDAAEILQSFAEHHAQSEARRRSHDELMQSDSNLDLEDFGALAASALGSQESHDTVLGEQTPEFTETDGHVTDTLPEQEAAPSNEADEHAPDDADKEAPDEGMTAEDVSHEDDADASPTETADDSPEEHAPDEEQVEAAEANVAPTEEPSSAKKTSSKKRTRKRKKKKS